MKKIGFIFALLSGFSIKSYGQTQVITVNNANGDNAHLMLSNPAAANFTNDTRATIWLDNDGRLRLRSVTGNGFAFGNTFNTADILNITDGGMGLIPVISRPGSFLTLMEA